METDYQSPFVQSAHHFLKHLGKLWEKFEGRGNWCVSPQMSGREELEAKSENLGRVPPPSLMLIRGHPECDSELTQFPLQRHPSASAQFAFLTLIVHPEGVELLWKRIIF